MNDRHAFLAVVGALGVWLLIHGGMAAYGLYHLSLVLAPPAPPDDVYVRWARENYAVFLTIVVALALLGALYLIACFGFVRKASWAKRVWLFFSAAGAALYLGSVASGVPWTKHLAALVLAALSCWYLRRAGTDANAG
jgi:hypothetical protein